MALRAGYHGVKKILPGLKINRPGVLGIDYTKLNVELGKTFLKRSEQAVLGAVNLIETQLTSDHDAGVSYVRNSDGTITCTNQATGSGGLKITKNFVLKGGMPYRITGCPSGGGDTTYKLVLRKAADNSYVAEDNGGGLIVIPVADTEYYLQVRYQQGYMANQTFKPMVCLNLNAVYDNYVPYAMTNRELTERAVPDYSTTEQNTGVKWIDGKSIYQKTISATISEITSIINHGITGLGEIIDLVGIFKMVNAPSGDITFIPLSKTAMLSSGESLDATHSVDVNYITGSNLNVRVGKNVVDPSVYSSVTLYLTFYYTKTS